MRPPEMITVSLASLGGTWRRRWIRRADGCEDATTSVLWVQAGRYYGDLRLPAAGDSGNPVEGFAGELLQAGDVFHWRRDIDLTPTGKRDAGRLRFLDVNQSTMAEDGADDPYAELWERVGTASHPVALRSEQNGSIRGWFVATGDDFVFATRTDPAGVVVSFGRRDRTGRNGTILASTERSREGTRAFDFDPREAGWLEVPTG